MFTINLMIIFAFGLVITAIVFKGLMQAQEYARQEEEVAEMQHSEDSHCNMSA